MKKKTKNIKITKKRIRFLIIKSLMNYADYNDTRNCKCPSCLEIKNLTNRIYDLMKGAK